MRRPIRSLVRFILGASAAIAAHSAVAEESTPQALVPAEAPVNPTVVEYHDYRDPLIGFNRAMFAFNDVATRFVLIPVAKGYRKVLPKQARRSIGNFFLNLKTPVYVVNHLLQGRPKVAGKDLARFGINSTIGLAGLFDPADFQFSISRDRTGFGDTLATYGTGYGAYLVLPLMGPSDLRSGTGFFVDSLLNPTRYFTENPERLELRVLNIVQSFAPQVERYEQLRAESTDPYIFFRNLHLQGVQRDANYEATE